MDHIGKQGFSCWKLKVNIQSKRAISPKNHLSPLRVCFEDASHILC